MGRRDGSDYFSSQGTWSSVLCRGRCVSSPDRKLLWLSLAHVLGLNGHFIRVFASHAHRQTTTQQHEVTHTRCLYPHTRHRVFLMVQHFPLAAAVACTAVWGYTALICLGHTYTHTHTHDGARSPAHLRLVAAIASMLIAAFSDPGIIPRVDPMDADDRSLHPTHPLPTAAPCSRHTRGST